MQLDRIQIVLRARNHWESVDLGFKMVQTWWVPLYKLWFITFMPVVSIVTIGNYSFKFLSVVSTVTIGTGTYSHEQSGSLLLIWWFKPVYDRVVLYFLSQALFGEQVTVQKLWQALPQLLLKTSLLKGLTLERFDLARSFRLPVRQLENLPKQSHQLRFLLLTQRTINPVKNFMMVCLLLEGGLFIALLGFVDLMILNTTELFGISLLDDSSIPSWMEDLSQIFCYGLALSLIEPLYVAGGFMLYLNRRIHLEGWDIELAFRRMVKRYASQHAHLD